jgi:hypothetical protein
MEIIFTILHIIVLYEPTWGEFDAEPDRHGHAPVVDNMQRRYVPVLFPQHEEELQHFQSFSETSA